MNPVQNFETVQPAEEREWAKPKAGGYVCMILGAEDVPFDQLRQKGDYLKVKFDISEGELCSYYTDIADKFGNWPSAATFVKSYKEKSIPYFKAFITSVEQSNPGYKWNWDEKTLNGKYIGIVFCEEEYEANDGTIKTRLKVDSVRSVQAIRDGDYKVPALKRIAPAGNDFANSTANYVPVGSDKLPF